MSEGTKVVDSPRTLVEGQRLDQPPSMRSTKRCCPVPGPN